MIVAYEVSNTCAVAGGSSRNPPSTAGGNLRSLPALSDSLQIRLQNKPLSFIQQRLPEIASFSILLRTCRYETLDANALFEISSTSPGRDRCFRRRPH